MRILQARGRRNDATGLLVSIYDQFDEGIDTKDLTDAKALSH